MQQRCKPSLHFKVCQSSGLENIWLVCISLCVCVCVFVCVCVCVCRCFCMCICVWSVCDCWCKCVCLYVYVFEVCVFVVVHVCVVLYSSAMWTLQTHSSLCVFRAPTHRQSNTPEKPRKRERRKEREDDRINQAWRKTKATGQGALSVILPPVGERRREAKEEEEEKKEVWNLPEESSLYFSGQLRVLLWD